MLVYEEQGNSFDEALNNLYDGYTFENNSLIVYAKELSLAPVVPSMQYLYGLLNENNAINLEIFDRDKNIVTLGQELHKGKNIQQNRYIMHNKIKSLYTKKLADQYIKDLESHVLYKHDESGTPGYPYCVAITMYPFLVDGLQKLGGQSVAPTDLKSFCGEFINLVYSVSSQFMGAVATDAVPIEN